MPATRLPWAKVPTSLLDQYDLWNLNPKTINVVFGVYLIAGSAESADTGMTPDALAWHLRTGIEHVQEAIGAGKLVLTDGGTIAVAVCVAMPGPATAAERVRNWRDRKTAGVVTHVTPQVTERVTDQVTPTAHTDNRREAETKTNTTTVVVGELVYPEVVHQSAQKAIAKELVGLAPAAAQEVLDELAGVLAAGKEIRSKVGWVRALAVKARAGEFSPELGIAVAHRRTHGDRRFVRPEPAKEAPPEEEIAKCRSLLETTDSPTAKRLLTTRISQLAGSMAGGVA